MGGRDVTEVIIEKAPAALNLLGELLSWVTVLALVEGKSLREKKLARKSSAQDESFENLDQDCMSRAVGHFNQEHGYPFAGDDSSPPHATNENVHGNEDFYNAQENNLGAISSAVQASVKGTTAPWATKGMIRDITSRLTMIIQGRPTNAFLQQGFSLTYTDSGEGGKSYQTDICWVYCTTLAPDPNDTERKVKTLFLYSIGVGYECPSWTHRLAAFSPSIPVVRISFAFTTAIIGTAVAAFIYSAKDKPTNINVTVDAKNLQGSITISTKGKPKIQPGESVPDIPHQWAVKALQEAGVVKNTVTFGAATASEAAEIGYLTDWEAAEP